MTEIPVWRVIQFLHFYKNQLATATQAGGAMIFCFCQQLDPSPQVFRFLCNTSD